MCMRVCDVCAWVYAMYAVFACACGYAMYVHGGMQACMGVCDCAWVYAMYAHVHGVCARTCIPYGVVQKQLAPPKCTHDTDHHQGGDEQWVNLRVRVMVRVRVSE